MHSSVLRDLDTYTPTPSGMAGDPGGKVGTLLAYPLLRRQSMEIVDILAVRSNPEEYFSNFSVLTNPGDPVKIWIDAGVLG